MFSHSLSGDLLSQADAELPMYHDGLLEIKFQSGVGAIGAAMAMNQPFTITRAAAAEELGLGTLMAYERGGLIRRVIPLAEEPPIAAALGETPMLTMFAEAAQSRVHEDPNVGVAFVELYRDQDVFKLEGELRRDPTISSVSRVPVRYLTAKKSAGSASAPGIAPAAAAPSPSALWNLAKIRWHEARQLPGFVDASGIQVAVLDTGFDTGHPDRPQHFGHYEFAHPTNANASSNRDIHGHGTHVGGTIAARINNNVGIEGICNCKLSAFKIFDDEPDWHPGLGYFTYFVNPVQYHRALARCLTLQMNVVNLSIGGRSPPSANEQALFQSLIQSGITVVAAMGNENSSIASYPAAIPGVIAVGATSINDMRASFSNYGGHISVVAPGVGIWSLLPTYAGNQGYRARPTFPPQPDFTKPIPRDTDYASWQGTSMAAPHVAGAVALLLAKSGGMSPANVKQKLEASALKIPAMAGQNFTVEYGYGRLDLVSLLS